MCYSYNAFQSSYYASDGSRKLYWRRPIKPFVTIPLLCSLLERHSWNPNLRNIFISSPFIILFSNGKFSSSPFLTAPGSTMLDDLEFRS